MSHRPAARHQPTDTSTSTSTSTSTNDDRSSQTINNHGINYYQDRQATTQDDP